MGREAHSSLRGSRLLVCGFGIRRGLQRLHGRVRGVASVSAYRHRVRDRAAVRVRPMGTYPAIIILF